MKNNNRKVIAFILIFFLIIIVVIKISKKDEIKISEETTNTIYVQTLEDGTKLNTSRKISETKKIDYLEISNAQLTNKNGKTVLLADVKNIGNAKINMVELKITLLDEKENEIDVLNGLLGTIKAGETAQLNIAATNDYSNIYDYKVEIKK